MSATLVQPARPLRRLDRAVAHDSSQDHHALAAFLSLGDRLLTSVEQHATSFAIALPDLPPVVGTAEDQLHLRTVPPLYFASELEAAGLLTAAETLAGLFATGGLTSDPGTAAPLLEELWRTRHQRFAAGERLAFYGRLFGGSADGPALAVAGARNEGFEDCMISFAEGLYKLHPDPALENLGLSSMGPASQVTLQMAAAALAENLAPRAGGMAAYAGRDLLNTINAAIHLLGHAAILRMFGARSLWTVVAAIQSTYLHATADVASHLTRGQSGMALLTWLAEMTQSLTDDRRFALAADDPSIAAATAWLEASLSLREGQAPQSAAPAMQASLRG